MCSQPTANIYSMIKTYEYKICVHATDQRLKTTGCHFPKLWDYWVPFPKVYKITGCHFPKYIRLLGSISQSIKDYWVPFPKVYVAQEYTIKIYTLRHI